MDVVAQVNDALTGTGLFVRGGFNPIPEDRVPPLRIGAGAGTVVLVGNAGNALWQAFAAAQSLGRNPLDRWIDPYLERAAQTIGADLVYATREPWPPILRWALKCDSVHRSPIGLLIHEQFGLWHVYRGALLLAERLPLPPRKRNASPCDACAKKPCLTTCPVGAFAPERFDSAVCVDHVDSARGAACAGGGCLARRACPVGRAHAYERAAGAFHMAAVVKAVRAAQRESLVSPDADT
jgi:hypothetical protein